MNNSILSVENFGGFFISKTRLWGSFSSTCDRLTYNFTPGVYALSGEIDSGGWAFAASLYPQSSKNIIMSPNDTTLYYMGKKTAIEEIQKHTCNLDYVPSSMLSRMLQSTVKTRIEKGLQKNHLDYMVEDICEMFFIDPERIDQPIQYVSGHIFCCNAAINFINGKTIFCFPWLSYKMFDYYLVRVEKICKILSDFGKLVLLPVSNQVNGLEKYNIIEFPRPLE